MRLCLSAPFTQNATLQRDPGSCGNMPDSSDEYVSRGVHEQPPEDGRLRVNFAESAARRVVVKMHTKLSAIMEG